MLSVLIIAIYMVAFLFDRKTNVVLIPCVICEFIGWSPLFEWSHGIHYGMLNHVMWGMVYAYYIMLRSPPGKQLLSCTIMVLFQLIMGIDCRSCEGNETILFILYKYIVVLIHCYIIFTFLSRKRIITTLGDIASIFRLFITSYGFNMHFWYTTIITHRK